MDTENLLKLLKEHNVDFVIIGATAFPVYGYVRAVSLQSLSDRFREKLRDTFTGSMPILIPSFLIQFQDYNDGDFAWFAV